MILYKGENKSIRRYSIAMVALAIFFLGPLFAEHMWEAGMVWQDGRNNESIPSMLKAMYLALSICLLMSAKDPVKSGPLIDYVVISSLLHGLVMAYFGVVLTWEHAHLWGDVPMLLITAVIFYFYHPRRLPQE